MTQAQREIHRFFHDQTERWYELLLNFANGAVQKDSHLFEYFIGKAFVTAYHTHKLRTWLETHFDVVPVNEDYLSEEVRWHNQFRNQPFDIDPENFFLTHPMYAKLTEFHARLDTYELSLDDVAEANLVYGYARILEVDAYRGLMVLMDHLDEPYEHTVYQDVIATLLFQVATFHQVITRRLEERYGLPHMTYRFDLDQFIFETWAAEHRSDMDEWLNKLSE